MSQTKVQLLRPDLGDVIDFDSSTLYMDGADNRVGIRNTNPQYELDVTGTVNATNFRGNISVGTIDDWITHTGDTNTKFGFSGNDTFQVHTSGTPSLQLDSGGRVLIGNASTYSASGDLHVVGDTNSNGPELYLQVNNNNTTDNIGALWYGNNVDKSLIKLAGHTHTANNTADFTVSTSAAGTLGEDIRINSGGRVNIGHLNQTGSHLDYTRVNIYGQTVAGGTNKNLNLLNVYNYGSGGVGDITGIGLGAGASPGGYTKASIGFVRTGTYGRGDLIFCVNSQGNGNQVVEGDERVRIQSDGGVVIGTTAVSAGDLATGTSIGNPKLFVDCGHLGNGAYHIARFRAGADHDNNAAVLTLNHSNDRGLALYGGRSSGDRSWIALRSIDSGGRVSNAIEIIGDEGQGVQDLKFYTGDATTTTLRLHIEADGQLIHKTNKASGYIAEFHQEHADNPGTIKIDSPTDNNLRPAALHLAQAGTVKWVLGQVYSSTSDRAFHLCAGTGEANSKFVVTTAGNVGIGNNNPTVKLAVDGGTANDATVVQIKNDSTSAYSTTDGGLNTALSLFSDGTNAAQGVGIQLYCQKSGETGCISEIGATRESNGNSTLVFRTRDSGTGVNERMRIKSNGYVGIGTVAPAYELHVWPGGTTSSGQICAQSNGSNTFAELVLKCTDGGTGSIWRNSSGKTDYGGANSLNIYQSVNAPIAFFTSGNNKRLEITGTGTIKTPYGIQSGGNATGGFQFNSQYSGKGFDIATQYATASNSGSNGADPMFSGWWGAQNTFRVNSNGQIKFGSNLVGGLRSGGFSIPHSNASGNTKTVTIAGLVSGAGYFSFGTYSSAGQGMAGICVCISGYQTATSCYQIQELQKWHTNNMTITSFTKWNTYASFTITNTHGSFTAGAHWHLWGNDELYVQVA